jgi:hypothetical protein
VSYERLSGLGLLWEGESRIDSPLIGPAASRRRTVIIRIIVAESFRDRIADLRTNPGTGAAS